MLFRITGYRRKKAISVKKKEKKLKRIVAGLIILTIVVTSLPNLHLEKTFGLEYSWWFDMLQHGGYYFMLGVTLFLLFPGKKHLQLILFYLCLGSLILEILQLWIPGRAFTQLDITSNYIGIAAAFLINFFILRPRYKRKHSIKTRV